METSTRSHEYTYTHSEPQHHHAYLLAPLLALLTQPSSSVHQKLRVLDLGCGNGSLSQKIAQAGYDVTGIENSESGIRLACQNVPECHFIQASIYDLPSVHLEQAFDIVIAAEVIEHLLYPRELIRVAKKRLKPNGQLIITTPYHGYWKNLVLAVRDLQVNKIPDLSRTLGLMRCYA